MFSLVSADHLVNIPLNLNCHSETVNKERFAGNKIMWIHTGGMFGFLDRSMDSDIENFNPIIKNYFD